MAATATTKEKKPRRVGKRAAAKLAEANGDDESVKELTASADQLNLDNNRSSTGVLTSEKNSRDIKIELYSLRFFSQILINESTIELNYGRRYGLIGANGSGKSTFLQSLAAREAPIPEHIDIYLLNSEYPPTEMTALEAVIDDAEKEIKRLEQMMEDILSEDPESQLLDSIYERIEDMDPATFESRAAMLLDGLGFSATRMKFKTKDLSGGWRMRVSLARALFVKPTLLILDEPTNHLDLGACVWLEEYLSKYDRILLLVSHSQDFLNTVCTNIIDLDHKHTLKYYSGNYDSFIKTKQENEVNQLKAYKKQQEEIADIKKFIASCGTFANLVKQAKSRQKILDKMEADGLIEAPPGEKLFDFFFNSAGPLPPPVLAFNDMSFSYSGKTSDLIYKNLEFGVDTESRIALVGPNGAGKSTLLKLMSGSLSPTSGSISRHSHLKIGVYSQHSADQLDLSKSAVDYLRSKFPHLPQDISTWRQNVGRFGLTGNSQLCPIAQLSDGQKARIVFAELSLESPNILLLDEPTNALDIETIDTLARAINNYNGGVVLVSHDFRLIRQVAKQIWVCESGTMTLWDDSITAYKNKLRKEVTKSLPKKRDFPASPNNISGRSATFKMSEKDNRTLRNSTFSSSSNPSGNGDNLVAPLTATMSQLSTAAKPTSLSFKIPAQKNAPQSSSTHKSSLSQNLQLHSSKNNNRLHRQRSKSMTLVQQNQDGPSTPTRTSSYSGIGLVKPSPSAFHSTGILSKKSRGVSGIPGNEVKITPETPIKNKRVLGSIWSGMDGPTNAASMLKMTGQSGGVATLMNRNVLNQETPLVKRSAPYNSSKFQNTPPGFSGKPPQIPASLGSSPFDLRFSINNQSTPSAASSSLKTNRLHRSPLKETPSKFAKRPHLDNHDDGKDINLEGYQENVQPVDLNHAASTNLEQRSKGNTSNISGMDIVIDDSSFVANTKTEDSSMISESPRSFKIQNVAKEPMQPPSAVEQQDQIPPSSSRISSHTNPSPVIPAKLFFSRIVKERKQTSAQHSVSSIPFHALISQYRHPIDKLFFDAIDGIQSALDSTLSLLSKRNQNEEILKTSIPDWFESRFELLGRLGHGEFADAFHVQSIDDGLEYAIKKTRHPFMGHKDALQKLNEVRMLLKVKSSPYCIKLQDAWIQFGYIYIQTELCKRGSLATYFEQYCSETPLSEEQIWRILADIIQGINHIHQQGIVHLDIKPGNIFISQNGTLKIGDFGLASQLPIINSDLEGDRTYLAPECLTNVNVSYPADIFSLGLILLEMAANIILPQNGDIWQQLREGNIEGINLHRHSQMLIDFIQSMLYSDPEQRPSCTDLLKHPKLASFL